VAGLKQLNWASEGVGATAAALVDLSTVAGNKISNPPWVKFQSAGWVNFPSAPTARLQQANRDLEERHKDRDAQIHSLEEKHRHARDTLEHYRQASKEQREQEQRRHESQVQQLQLELRQLQQTLIIKQDELTQLNRDNARLLTEARQLQKERHAQQQLVAQKTQTLEALQSTLAGS
jgi:DNA repair exonuclease SbcCD ATPase subunit